MLGLRRSRYIGVICREIPGKGPRWTFFEKGTALKLLTVKMPGVGNCPESIRMFHWNLLNFNLKAFFTNLEEVNHTYLILSLDMVARLSILFKN